MEATDFGLAAAMRPRAPARAATSPRAIAVWCFRLPLAIPFVLMGPEILSAIAGRAGAVANISASTADVLGTSSFLILVTLLCVTPVATVTGWSWHVVLRRDYGIAMFFTAATDLVLAALTTGDRFPGGVLARIGGHSFLVAGTLATLLLVPIVLTANRRAQRWLGRYWTSIQRLTYAVWVVVLIHLLLLFGLSSIFLYALAVSAPLLFLRVPAVRRRWLAARRSGERRVVRAAAGLLLLAVFMTGYVPLVNELAIKGSAAFVQHPAKD